MHGMFNRQKQGCVLGHSFLSSLTHHVAARHHGNYNPKIVTRELKLNLLLQELHFLGNRDACVMD